MCDENTIIFIIWISLTVRPKRLGNIVNMCLLTLLIFSPYSMPSIIVMGCINIFFLNTFIRQTA